MLFLTIAGGALFGFGCALLAEQTYRLLDELFPAK